MDPNETLAEIKELLTVSLPERDKYWHDRIAGKFEALDEWLSRGGFLPTEWRGCSGDHREDEFGYLDNHEHTR